MDGRDDSALLFGRDDSAMLFGVKQQAAEPVEKSSAESSNQLLGAATANRNIMAQGEKLRNRTPVTPAPLVAPAVVSPIKPAEEELAAATVNPFIARQGEKQRERLGKLAPTPPVVEAIKPPVPYKDRREALDDAVNFLEENVDPKRVSEYFSTLGITEEDITRHGRERGSQYFAPQQLPTGFPEKFIPSGASIKATPDEYGIDDVARSFKRAGANLRDMSTSLLFSAGVVNPDEAAGLIRQNARDRLAAAPSESTQAGLIAIGNAKTYGDAIQAMYDYPPAMFSMMADSVLTSLPALAPSLLLGPAGIAARGAAAFIGSGGSEYASVMTDVLQDKNIDLRDADKVARALKDPKILAEMKEKGAARGLIVGAFDGLTMGLAGRFMNPARSLIAAGELSGVAARKATMAAWGKELAMQVAGGAGGEFAAQKATGENKPAAVLLEGLMEGVTGPLEISSSLKAPSKQEILGRALNDEINNTTFTEDGINQEALNRLNPDQAQYTSTSAPARRPQAPQGTVTAAPIAPAVAAAEPITEATPIEEQRVVPKGLLGPGDFEPSAIDESEDVSVTPVTLNNSLPVTPTVAGETPPLEVFKNLSENTQSRIVQLKDGRYSVTLQDLETNEILPTARIFPSERLADAQKFAKEIANLPPDMKVEEKTSAAPKEVSEVVEKKTGPDEESGPFVQHKIEDFPTFYPLVAQLKMSEDVPQFKYGANEKGVVEPLGGTFDTSGVAPIQVWVRKNGDLEVISGRHRLDLAKRSGRVTIPAQYHYESKGFDKERAAILDAEFNIRDNQGKVKDYVNYFKGAKLSREEADSRGLLAKDLGKRGYTIANEGSEELIAAHRGDVVGDEAAYLIAKNAPQDGRLQSVGIKAIQDGKSISTVINTMQAVKALAGESQTSVDMFGFDDSAMKEADEMASIAARKQREISQRLSAITGAAKNPVLAKAEGIDIKDPAAVKKRIEELRQLKASWDNWSTNPDLVGEIRQERGPKPLTLTRETEVEIKEREKKEKADEAASEKAAKDAEAKEKADREKKAIADASKKSNVTLTPSEEVGKAEQAEIDRKKAEQELSGQGGMFDEEEKTSSITRIKDKLIRFASGMTAIKDLVNGAYARSGHINHGIGVDVGLLSDNGIKALANAILNLRVPVFVDSGAFSNFTKTIKGKEVKPLDFDKILEKYDQITEEISNQNEVENTDYPRPMFVMPDIVGNQAASIDLIKKHKTWIKVELSSNLSQPIIPIQKGDISLADAYKEIVRILGTDNFIVGIPSAEAAVSKDELAEFLKEAKPKRVHFLGSAADSKLNPKIAIVAQYSPDTDVTADASKVRSAILNGVAEGKTREQAITDALTEEGDQGYLLDLYGPKENKANEIAIAEKLDKQKNETKEPYTKEQREDALAHAKETGGEVVWQKGEHALIRGYSVLSGDPVYVPTMGGSRGRVDISSYTGKQIPDDIKAEMIKEKERLENEAANKHEKKPFITFGDGIALSNDIPSKIAGVIREWKKLLNLEPNIYVSTIDDAQENKFNFTGPHRRIGSGTLNANEKGSMRLMSDGSYYILFTKSTSITKMLEVIAHEMGHLHQKQFFDNATAKEKEALQTAHRNWLEKQKGKTAKELAIALRAKTSGKQTFMPEGMMADSLVPYWRSFNEWYADQTARWAVSSEKPVSIVEFYFRRLGLALRKFYQSLKAQKYLPDETFKQYIEAATRRPANIVPSGDEASLMQQGFDFEEESNVTDKLAAENPVESKALNEMDQLPTAKKKLPPGRSPELAAAAQMVKDGTMTSAQFDSLVNKYKPIYLYAESLIPASTDKMVDALDSAKKGKVNPQIQSGTAVGLRLDIPAFTRKGVYVVSIHNKGTKSGPGKVIGYSSVAKVTNARFGLGNQNAALAIASGAGKDALQTIEGSYVSITPEQAYEQAKSALINPAWTQIGIDPTRHSYFYDRRTTVPVVAAEEILQIGNMVLGKNVTFGKKEDFLFNIDSQPAISAEELAKRNADIRREQMSEYAGIRRQMMSAIGKVAEGEVSTDLQRRLTSLIGRSRDLKMAIVTTIPVRTSPETFLAKALSEYAAGNISADVLAVVQAAYNKYPQLLDGMRFSVKSHSKGSDSRASAGFVPLARIVRLFKSTTGATDPKSIRHELNHSLEQMMSDTQRQVVFDAWLKDLQKASEKNKDEAHQNFFNAVINFIENSSVANHEKAMAALPSYEMYQYVNPSEYWAVNAEKLMASQLGTAWQRFKLFVKRMFEGLKSVFGFDNKYAVHKVFNQIMSGEMNRISHRQLADMVTGDIDFVALNNLKDDMDLVEKYNRPKTPMIGTSSIKKNILSATSKAKAVFKQGVEDPKSLGIDAINLVDRGTIYLRNKNVWFGSGLDTANFSRYEGQMRDTNGIVNSSIALDNAIRSSVISTQVIMQGGIKYDPNTMNYVANKRSKGMAGVYKAESVIKKRLGDQLGTDIIQGYLEAKRSLSIRNELDARQDQVDQLKDDLLDLQAKPGVDPVDIDALKVELSEARKSLTSIKLVERKVSMSNQEIQEFLDREKAHPELRDIMNNWNAVNQNMLNFWFDVGLFSEARYELLSNIKDYIPWYRIMDDGSVSSDTTEVKSVLQSTTRSMTNIGKEKIFKSGKPSVTTEFVAKNGQQTFKIQPSTVVNVEINGNQVNPSDVVSSSDGNVTINVPIAEGDIVEFKTNREIQNMIDNMTRNVMRMTINGLRKYAANRIVSDYATRNQKKQIRVFPKADKEKGRFNYISHGRNLVVEIKDPLIAEAIFGLENLNIEMLKGFAAITNFVRRSITLSGAFQIKQVFKDAPTAAWVTGVKRPDLLIGGVYKGFVTSLLRPLANQLGKKITGRDYDIEPVIEILTAAGIGGFHSPSRTPEAEIKMQIGLMNRNAVSFILKGLDHIGDSSDMSQRVATYKRVLAETKDEAQALYQAANVINFLHHGSAQHAQAIIKTVPFMSAWANSLDVLVQSLAGGGLKGKKRSAALKQIAITGAALATTTLLYCMLVGGDEEYEKLDDQTKLRGYMIPGTEIMLPMNTSAGFLFKVLPELLYNKFVIDSTEKPQDATRLRKALRDAATDMILGPEPVPAAVKPILEITFKHDFFTGRPVVPAGLENIESFQQYTATTSELGKFLSGLTGTEKTRLLNPIEADHIVRGMFGSVGALSMWASNLIGEAAERRPEMTAKQTPFIGAFLRPAIPRGPEDLFYDFKKRVEEKYKTMEIEIARQDIKAVLPNIEENKRLIAMHDYVTNTNEELNKINETVREISEGKMNPMSPQKKRKTIEMLQRAKNSTLTGVEKMRSISGL